jgi:hypothetical protein
VIRSSGFPASPILDTGSSTNKGNWQNNLSLQDTEYQIKAPKIAF